MSHKCPATSGMSISASRWNEPSRSLMLSMSACTPRSNLRRPVKWPSPDLTTTDAADDNDHAPAQLRADQWNSALYGYDPISPFNQKRRCLCRLTTGYSQHYLDQAVAI